MAADSFSERLRELREAAGLSQYALAKLSGVSKQTLSKLEMGPQEPGWVTVQRLALALNVDCRQFADPEIVPPDPKPARPPGRPKKAGPPVAAEGARPAKPGRPKKVSAAAAPTPKKPRPPKGSA